MAIGYAVVPLDDEIRDHLVDQGVESCPGEDGRNPTPAEVRATAAKLGLVIAPDAPWDTQVASTWDATISHTGEGGSEPWASFSLSNVRSEDQPAELYFERGWHDLIVRFLVELARKSGPLVVIDDAGSTPLVVTGRVEAEQLLEEEPEDA